MNTKCEVCGARYGLGWIQRVAVEDRLPAEDALCIVYNDNTVDTIPIRAYFRAGDFFPLDAPWKFPLKITHWILLEG